MKIFNFGLPRTGTTSFHNFLINNNIDSTHTNNGFIAKIYPTEYAKFLRDEPSLIEKFIENHEAFGDLPWYSLASKIIEKYENEKFVATTRSSKDEWFESMLKIQKNMNNPKSKPYHDFIYKNSLNNKKFMLNFFKNHYKNLEKLEKKHNIKIHILNLEDIDSIVKTMSEICLITNKTYPHLNKSIL